MGNPGLSFPGRGNGKCKGPEAEILLISFNLCEELGS